MSMQESTRGRALLCDAFCVVRCPRPLRIQLASRLARMESSVYVLVCSFAPLFALLGAVKLGVLCVRVCSDNVSFASFLIFNHEKPASLRTSPSCLSTRRCASIFVRFHILQVSGFDRSIDRRNLRAFLGFRRCRQVNEGREEESMKTTQI